MSYHPPLGKSDHVCITCKLQFSCISRRSDEITISVVDYEQLNASLLLVDWPNVLAVDDIDCMWSTFMDTVLRAITSNTRQRTIRRCFSKPWITPELFRLIKVKKSLWQRFRRSNTGGDFEAHRRFSNYVSESLRRAKRQYEDGLVQSGDKRKFYKYVRANIGTRVSSLLLRDASGNICDGPQVVANGFADCFSGVFADEPDVMPTLSVPRCQATLEDIQFSPQLILEELNSLKLSTSPGPGGLSAAVLKFCSSGLCVPLSIIMQESLRAMTLPGCWKEASVTPIYKGGDKLDPNNYRPVSIVPIAAKVAERVILRGIMPFLLANGVVPAQQHGFIPGRSVLTNLLTCVNDWTNSFDRGMPVDVIYLDFSKAFDRVPKKRLLLKLEHSGIRGRLLGWISDFLSSRTFAVRVGNTLSAKCDVLSGVPQGSVLGPVLFLIFVSDLPPSLASRCAMFADDLKLYANPLVDHVTLQRDLITVSEWCSTWLLPLNVSKCCVLHIGKSNPHVQYIIGGSFVESVASHNDLGIIVTTDLTWSEHIISVINKANKLVYLISKTFRYCSPLTAAKLFTTYVRPVLEFSAPVWHPDLIRDQNALEAVQRRCTRLPYGRTRPTYEDRLAIMKLPTFSQRRQRGDLIVTYRALHFCFGLDMSYLFELNLNNLRGHSYKLKKQTCSTTVRRNFVSSRVFSAWNQLPATVVEAPSVNSFKNRFDALSETVR